MTPPPAEELVPRLFRGPALRTQPDRRLVALVRQGYETAFEEIVRRYGKPVHRYATAIVGARGEDVTQDAFSKALLALRRDGAEIELRPWLFRIVRNTALNDLRDRPPSPEVLAEAIAGGRNPAEEAERREELADLIRRLQSLPEPQRVAIVMRELEGLSHEEIAAALGLSGGGARQTIYRARQALRDGLGMLLPLPLLKALLAGTAAAPVDVASGVAGAGGAGLALKAATATVLVAGAVGAGVAVHENRQVEDRAVAQTERIAGGGATAATAEGSEGSGSGREPGDDHGSRGPSGDQHGGHAGDDDETAAGDRGGHGRGPGGDRDGNDPESGTDHGGRSGPAGHEEGDDGSHRSGSSEEDSSGSGDHGSGEHGGLDDHSGSGDDSPSSGGDDSASSEGSGSNSGPGSGGSEDGEASDSEHSGDSHDGDGLSLQTDPPTEEER